MANINYYKDDVHRLPLHESTLRGIIEKAKHWALTHGIAIRSRTECCSDSLSHVPFVIPPTPFPKSQFDKAIAMQALFNELMHKVANDRQFLTDSLEATIKADPFTRNLFKIYEIVMEEGRAQGIMLGLLRCDYMLDRDDDDDVNIKQVEINTIASSFGAIATNLSAMNRYVLNRLGYSTEAISDHIPHNDITSGASNGIFEAWKAYGDENAAVLFIVEATTFNICDQRFLEYKLLELRSDLKILRRTLTEIAIKSRLDQEKQLIIDDEYPVAVVYFRAGYEPGHYPSQKEWDARLLLERSKAIKCPSIEYHLAGTKKIQQILSSPVVLEKFLADRQRVSDVKRVTTGLYGLGPDDEFGSANVRMALDRPDRFVLKPQREGGGNNVYGADIRERLSAMKSEDAGERSAWILMDLIKPPITKGYIVRPHEHGTLPALRDIVSELGVFGVILGDSHRIMINKQVGHMLRSKESTENEGGVAVGIGALDIPYLID